MEENENIVCSKCEGIIEKDDDFCPGCGTLLAEFVKCENHSGRDAKGVCVICAEPYCEECGIFVDDRIFLCAGHSEYDTLEGMAAVYSNGDTIQIGLAKANLEEKGLHPFVYLKKANTVGTSLIYNSYDINEYQLMVPFLEVLTAEEILRDLDLID